MRYASWETWFQKKPTNEEINQSKQEWLFAHFNGSTPDADILHQLERETNVCFLFRENFGDDKVNLFHHFMRTGGSVTDESIHYAFIQGVQTQATHIITPNITILQTNPGDTPFPVPTNGTLLGLKQVDNIQNLDLSPRAKLDAWAFIPIPPFLLDVTIASLKAHHGNTGHLLLDLIRTMKEFDIEVADNSDFTEKACEKSIYILQWLFLVITDKIPKLETRVSSSDLIQRAVVALNQQEHIGQDDSLAQSNGEEDEDSTSPSNIHRSFEMIASSIANSNECMVKLAHVQSEKMARSFGKLNSRYQNMFFVASSLGPIKEDTVNAKAMEFFKQSSVLNAQIFLNGLMEANGVDISVSPAVTTALMHGSLLWKDDLTPSGLASSVLTSQGVLKANDLTEGIVLDYSTKHDMSAAALEKLTKTQVVFPPDIPQMLERIKALQILAALLFGERSFLDQGLTGLLTKFDANKQMLCVKLYSDKMFIAKVLYSIDERVYYWLRECMRCDNVNDTNLELTVFSSIFTNIQLGSFYRHLPPSVAKVLDDTRETNTTTNGKTNANKKTKRAKKLFNQDRNQAWCIKANENYESTFAGVKTNAPTLSCGSHPCLKWHVRGACWDDCTNASSHRKLDGQDLAKTTKFIKELRGE